MQFLDFREAGFSEIVCDLGRRFTNAEEAVAHVMNHHLSDAEKANPILALHRVATMLSPNPVPPEAFINAT